MTNFFNQDYTWHAFDKLATRTPADSDGLETKLSKLSKSSAHGPASSLESLPSEILGMILDNDALSLPDRLAVGLCSKPLWRHSLDLIRAASSKATWAKTPLICTGTYLTDLPPKIHDIDPSAKSLEEAWQTQLHSEGLGWSYGMFELAPARQWNWNLISATRDTSADDPNAWLNSFDAMAYNTKNGIPVSQKKVLRESLGHVLSINEPKLGSRWLLRNHDTREYARLYSKFNSIMQQQLHVQGSAWLSLDKALLMRISWTTLTHPHRHLPAQDKFLQGSWAGQRFDIGPADGGDRQHGGEAWRDVTSELVREGREWKACFCP